MAAAERLAASSHLLSGDSEPAPAPAPAPSVVSGRAGALVEGVRHFYQTGEVPLSRGEALGYAEEARQRAELLGQRLRQEMVRIKQACRTARLACYMYGRTCVCVCVCVCVHV